EDVQANAPWQRLRPTLLLLLQLLAVAALVLAMARPAYTQVRQVTGDVIAIVDQSYGMQAQDVRPSRFAAALRQGHDLAHQLTPGNVMSVIGMASQPRLAIAESDDPSAIDQAIDGLHPTDATPNFLAALSLASSLARSGETTRVLVLTSRESGITGLPVAVPFPVTVERLGGRLRDLGIVGFQAARGGNRTRAVLSVRNFGQRAATSDLDLEVDGQLADVRPVRLAPGQQVNLFWDQLPAGVRQLRARLSQSDDMAGDKVAWAVVPVERARRVLLVTRGNYFLQAALVLDPSVQLSMVNPAFYTPDSVRFFDLVVFDRAAPPLLPSVPSLVIGPPAGQLGPLRVGAERPVGGVTAASVPSGGSGSPSGGSGSPPDSDLGGLLQYVDFSDVHVAQARTVALPGWLQPVALSGRTVLIAAGQNGGTRLVLITFDLQKSDWPLRVSYPVAIRNFLEYLVPSLAVGTPSVRLGQVVPLSLGPGTRRVLVTKPDGAVDRVPATGAFSDTNERGVYTLTLPGSTARASFAVNFFHPVMTSAPGPRILTFGHSGARLTRSVTTPLSFAWVFGALALTVLSLEWWVALRR
ncbi:MAG: VWA domain-containing protein, partial [Chloroflexi bacterium]|nr:VWA domain-containing protein [Chloroflexota bacterium]